MADSEQPRCRATRGDGKPCRAAARPSGFCLFHDPEMSAKREAARRAGGRKRSRGAAVLPDASDLPAASIADVTSLLGRTVNDVRQGRLDPKVANSIAYLSSVLLRALQEGELESRLAALEAQLAAQGGAQ